MPGTTSAAAPAAAAPLTAAPVAAAPVAAPVAAPAADRIFAVAELPAEVQRDLPKLSISGGVHSENAAQRMLIVGGQVLGEGAVVAPGVTLEQIRPHVAVLRFRGYRYSLGY
jgi:general secretion pathway protein B